VGLLDSFGGLKRRTAKQLTGDSGEDQALLYLQERRLKLVERNFRCKGGEIDLIMLDQAVLVFVEVRKRAAGAEQFGGAAASVTPAKQRRLIVAAQVYLKRYTHPPACRFDVVTIDGGELNWLKNAIEAQ
jgi:putative endonuclease